MDGQDEQTSFSCFMLHSHPGRLEYIHACTCKLEKLRLRFSKRTPHASSFTANVPLEERQVKTCSREHLH